jgi:hypothetical protein
MSRRLRSAAVVEAPDKTIDYYMSLPYTVEIKYDAESDWP